VRNFFIFQPENGRQQLSNHIAEQSADVGLREAFVQTTCERPGTYGLRQKRWGHSDTTVAALGCKCRRLQILRCYL